MRGTLGLSDLRIKARVLVAVLTGRERGMMIGPTTMSRLQPSEWLLVVSSRTESIKNIKV